MSKSWRPTAIAREIVRNLRADWMWNALTFVIAFATIIFVLVSDLNAISTSITAERHLVASGKQVVVVDTIDLSNGPAVSSSNCVSLSQNDHVIVAGGLSKVGIATIPSHPGHPFRVYGGTGSIRRVLDPSNSSITGGAVAVHLSRQLGLRHGDQASLIIDGTHAGTTEQRVSIFNPSRHELGDGIWLVDHYTPKVDECWVEFDHTAANHGYSIVSARFSTNRNTSISSLIPDDDLIVNPRDQFRNRSLGGNYVLIGALLGAPTALGIWLQRSRGGLYRSFGASARTTAVIIGTPALWVVSLAAAGAWAVVRAWAQVTGLVAGADGWLVAMRGLLVAGATGVVVIVVSSLAVSHGDITNQLKDRV